MIEIPNVTIGETRRMSDAMRTHARNSQNNPQHTLRDFALFKVTKVTFDFDKKRFMVHIDSLVNVGAGWGVPPHIAESCEIV